MFVQGLTEGALSIRLQTISNHRFLITRQRKIKKIYKFFDGKTTLVTPHLQYCIRRHLVYNNKLSFRSKITISMNLLDGDVGQIFLRISDHSIHTLKTGTNQTVLFRGFPTFTSAWYTCNGNDGDGWTGPLGCLFLFSIMLRIRVLTLIRNSTTTLPCNPEIRHLYHFTLQQLFIAKS